MNANEARKTVAAIWTNAKAKDLKGIGKDDLLWLIEVAKHFKAKKEEMASILNRYRVGYETSHTSTGRASKRCGDELSVLLTGLDHVQAAAFADAVLDKESGWAFERYSHLNNGQIRMNSGNLIRGALKRGEVTMDDVKAKAKQAFAA